jgi:hypothetical protein
VECPKQTLRLAPFDQIWGSTARASSARADGSRVEAELRKEVIVGGDGSVSSAIDGHQSHKSG